MKVVQVAKPNAPLELVERATPEPAAGQVRIKVQACGVCHSDMFTVTGGFPGIQFPRVPGHEIVGLIDARRAWRTGLEKRCPGRRGLAWRSLRSLQLVSARGFHPLCHRADSRHFL